VVRPEIAKERRDDQEGTTGRTLKSIFFPPVVATGVAARLRAAATEEEAAGMTAPSVLFLPRSMASTSAGVGGAEILAPGEGEMGPVVRSAEE
jgi:hypothetical protein